MNRATAMMWLESLACTGVPVHPNMKRQLIEAVGELTPEEDERLLRITRGRDAREERQRAEMVEMFERLREQR
jgi:hypothetical protein